MASQVVTTRIRDDELLALMEELLGVVGWTYESLTNIACVIGPGGFTSLRVAVTFANVLADQLEIPSAGIHLSDLYLAQVAPHPALRPVRLVGRGGQAQGDIVEVGEGILWLHSTRRDSLFVRGLQWREPTLIGLSEFAAEIHESPLRGGRWCGELLPEHEALVTSAGLVPAELRNIIEILPSFLSAMSFEKRPLLPWYGRDG